MASNSASGLSRGASWFISASLLIVVGGLMLLAYGLWRTPVPRPEPDELRQLFATRHAKLLQLAASPAITANRPRLAHADAIVALLDEAREIHSEAIERLIDRDVTIWNWSRAIATSHRDAERQREYWFVFHSEKFELFKLEVRDLQTRELQHSFRHEKDGSLTFRRLGDDASFLTHTNGALATVSLPVADGTRVQMDWNPDGSLQERRSPRKANR